MQQHPFASAEPNDTDSGFMVFVLDKPGGDFRKCEDLPAFQSHMEQEAARGLLLYEPPAEYLAKCLGSGNAGGAELDRWATEAMAYLKVRRRMPARLEIFEKPGDPTALGDLAEAFEKAFPGSAIPFTTPLSNRAEPFYGALATLAVAQHAIADRLHAELRAGSGPSGHPPPDTAAVLQSACMAWERLVADKEDIKTAQGRASLELDALKEELASARSRDRAARSELEAALAAKAEAGEMQRLVAGQLKDVEKELLSMHGEKAALNETVEKITRRETEAQIALRMSREELARTRTGEIEARAALLQAREDLVRAQTDETEALSALQGLISDLRHARAGEAAARAELRSVQDSLDQLRTSQIEAQARLLFLEKALADARTEHTDTETRLSAVLIQLSESQAREDAAQRDLETLRGEHAARQTEMEARRARDANAFEARLKQMEQRQAEELEGRKIAEQSVEALSYELSLVYASSSWHLTKPVRYFKKILGRADKTPTPEGKA